MTLDIDKVCVSLKRRRGWNDTTLAMRLQTTPTFLHRVRTGQAAPTLSFLISLHAVTKETIELETHGDPLHKVLIVLLAVAFTIVALLVGRLW